MQKGILYLIDRMAIGGTEGQLRALLSGLDSKKFQPHLCTLGPSDPGALFPDIPSLLLPYKSFYHASILSCIYQLSGYVRRHGISIVQAFFQDPTVLAALSRPFHSAVLVGSFRDLGFWRTSKEALKMRMAYPAFDGFIANSNAVKEHFVKTDNIPSYKIEVIHNGIVVSPQTDSIYCNNSKNCLIVGIVSNLNRHVKRVDDFIRAAAIVKDRIPNVRFVIVGDGELRKDLEHLSGVIGLSDRLKFVGKINSPIELIRTLTVGVNSSLTEGFSNAVLEYMSCGIPVVATKNGGNLEMIQEGVNGFLVPVGDVHLMAERITTLLQEEALRQKMCLANIDLVRSCFSMNQMIQRHECFYDNLLGHQ